MTNEIVNLPKTDIYGSTLLIFMEMKSLISVHFEAVKIYQSDYRQRSTLY